GPVFGLCARLHGLQLRSLDLLGRGGDIHLALPRPTGTTYLSLAGRVSRVTIERAQGVGIGISTQAGLNAIALDGRWFPSLEPGARLETVSFSRTLSRYEIGLAARASQITVSTRS